MLSFTPLVEGSGSCGFFGCPAKSATSASKSVSIKSEPVDVFMFCGDIVLLVDKRCEPCIFMLSVSPFVEPALLPGLANGLPGVCVALAGVVLAPAHELDLANGDAHSAASCS